MNKEILTKIKNKGSLLSIHILNSLSEIKRNDESIYMYNGIYYNVLRKNDLKKIIYKFMVDNNILDAFKTNVINDIIQSLKSNFNIETVEMDNYDNLLNVNNGIVNIETGELVPHSDKYNFSYVIDVDYDPKAQDCTYFLGLLSKIFNNENDTISNICRIGGYLLYPKNEIEKMFFFLGDGANGKSILLEIYKLFFPKKNISCLSLQQLSSDSFLRSQLLKSRVNVASETKGGKIDSEELKKIVSGEPITVNVKYDEPINFIPFTKIIIASNTKPYFNDTSHGIMRRLHIIEFKSIFMDKEEYDKEFDHEKRNIYLKIHKKEIFKNIDKEKSSIFNLFLKFLKDLKEKDWVLPETLNTKIIKEEYMEKADIMGTFLREYYEIKKEDDPSPDLDVKDIFKEFREWYCNNFEEKKFNHSTVGIGLKIKSIFRVNSIKFYGKDHKNDRNKSTLYPIVRRELNLEEELNIK